MHQFRRTDKKNMNAYSRNEYFLINFPLSKQWMDVCIVFVSVCHFGNIRSTDFRTKLDGLQVCVS